jgi:hypothetical protein
MPATLNLEQIRANDYVGALNAQRDALFPYQTKTATGLASAKALRDSYNLGRVLEDKQQGVEWDVSCELNRRAPNFQTNGWKVPAVALLGRDLSETGNAGANLVGQNYTTGELFPFFRNYAVCGAAGARFLVAPTWANLSVPRQDTTSSVSWNSENNAITASTFTFDSVPVKFYRLSAQVYFSNQLLQQATISKSILDVVRADLSEAVAVGIDYAALAGTGTSNQPTGLLAITPGSGLANTQSISLSAPPAWSDILQTQYLAESANVRPDGTSAWVTSPASKKHLKGLPKVTSASTLGFLWEANSDEISGQRAFATQQVAATNQLIYSPRWSELQVYMAGQVSLLVDRYTAAQNSQTRVIVDALVGVIARHANAFVISTGGAN